LKIFDYSTRSLFISSHVRWSWDLDNHLHNGISEQMEKQTKNHVTR
jgi:hypothetical protein